MKALLEIHALQNFAPSNLNRDDTGSPKDSEFGGYRRARISSQSLKRAMRTYVGKEKLLTEDELAVRTLRVAGKLAGLLEEKGRDPEDAGAVVEFALSGLSLTLVGAKTQYLLYLGAREIAGMAAVIDANWEALMAAKPSEAQASDDKASTGKRKKADAKKQVPTEVVKALMDKLDGGKAVDLALFGRMLADLPEKNRDAACQVAHAISTNATRREFDFFTAVDDLNPDDTAAAGMLGTTEFTSACYYRYAALDLEKFRDNLNDDGLVGRSLAAFLQAAYHAAPSGKQNSFAAHNPPAFFAVSVRSGVAPRNLANAFERPVKPGHDGSASLTERSVERLDAQWRAFDEVLGVGGSNEVAVLSFADGAEYLGQYVRPTLSALIDASVEAARKLFG